MLLIARTEDWFSNKLIDVNCSPIAKSYIVNVFSNIDVQKNMLHDQSITLAWFDAKKSHSFVKYQKIGDWILWVKSMYPASVSKDQNVIDSIGKLSYYACYDMLFRQWALYKELADNLPEITVSINKQLKTIDLDPIESK